LKKIKIGSKVIGENSPCFIIAEAGSNWRYCSDMAKNFRHALKLIDIAADAKADAVKFQLYQAKKLYVRDAGSADYIGKKKSIYQIIKEMELPYEWLPRLKEYCDKKRIIFLCTPFDEESADRLEKIGIPAYKAASYTITYVPLLRYIAKKGKPIILSTGASNIKEIKEAIGCIKNEGNSQIAIMQCTAKYPAPLETINLKVIPKLIKEFGIPIGLSDHSREPLIAPLGAVALGARIIEKHFTTDNRLNGPDHSFAILPDELIEMVDSIRKLEKALGKENKKLQEEEKELHNFARRSIYSIKEIKKGEKLTIKNIAALRPGKAKKGLEPKFFDAILGKKAKRDIKSGKEILKGDVLDKD